MKHASWERSCEGIVLDTSHLPRSDNALAICATRGPEQRSRDAAVDASKVQHGAGTHSASPKILHPPENSAPRGQRGQAGSRPHIDWSACAGHHASAGLRPMRRDQTPRGQSIAQRIGSYLGQAAVGGNNPSKTPAPLRCRKRIAGRKHGACRGRGRPSPLVGRGARPKIDPNLESLGARRKEGGAVYLE